MAERATGWLDKAGMHFATEAQADASSAAINLREWFTGTSATVADMMGHGFADASVIALADIINHAAELLPILAAYVKAQSNG